jgi:hypothetical protein
VREVMENALNSAAEALECWLRDGIEAAMNRYNTQRGLKENNNPSDDS